MVISSRWLAFVLSLVLGFVSLLPFILANSIVPEGSQFSGFLINPLDGHSYLAKMRQGFEGRWLFHLPYIDEPGQGSLLFVFYLILGHVSRWVGTELITTFHAARVLTVTLMYFMAFRLSCTILTRGRAIGLAYLFLAIGSGLGWIAVLFGIQATDLMIPESILFYSTLVNPHFPLAAALMFGTVLLALQGHGVPVNFVVSLALGLSAAFILPFSFLTTFSLLALWFAWEWMIVRRATNSWRVLPNQPSAGILVGVALGGAGPILYDLYIVYAHPVLADWSDQNVTPSPGLLAFGIGYGLILILAILSIVWLRQYERVNGRLLISWIVITFILIYAPLSLQRRFSLGLFLPLALLAAQFADEIISGRWGLKWVTALIVVIVIPSNLLVILAGLNQLQADDTLSYHKGELVAYQWLDRQGIVENPLVLTGAVSGNRLPAHATARVIYGHPFETPDSLSQLSEVERLLELNDRSRIAISELRSLDIDFVLLTQRELQDGTPSWANELEQLFASDGVVVLGVSP